jgi:MoxR-like ATPase
MMGKFTEPDEIFGPVDIMALKSGTRKRITRGKLPEAHWAFLDEFWKSSTAIANSLLRVVNEKKYDNGEGDVSVPLRVFVAASNEYPQDGELGAMFDRFVLRKEVRYVQKRESLRALISKQDHRPKLPYTITLAELDQGMREAMAMEISEEITEKILQILDELIAAGIRPSDRRLPKIMAVVKAFAWIQGATTVEEEHLEILSHMLWNDPTEQPRKVAEIVNKIANPLMAILNAKMMEADSVFQAMRKTGDAIPMRTKAVDATTKLQEIQEQIKKLKADPRRDKAVKEVAELIRQCHRIITMGTL